MSTRQHSHANIAPETKPWTNRTPGPATAQDAAETFDVLGGTDLLREQNHAPHEQQNFNGDEEISRAATKLLMIANTATPLSTEMIAAFEFCSDAVAKLLRVLLEMGPQPEQEEGIQEPDDPLEDHESRREIAVALSNRLDHAVHSMPVEAARSWPTAIKWLNDTECGTIASRNNWFIHRFLYEADEPERRQSNSVADGISYILILSTIFRVFATDIRNGPACPIALHIDAWLRRSAPFLAKMCVILMETILDDVAPFKFTMDEIPDFETDSEQPEVVDFYIKMLPFTTKITDWFYGQAGHTTTMGDIGHVAAMETHDASNSELSRCQRELATLRDAHRRVEETRVSDTAMHTATLAATADSKADAKIRAGLMNSQAAIDALMIIPANLDCLTDIAAMPGDDVLSTIRAATANPDIARCLTCEISASHAARSPAAYQLSAIRKKMKTYFGQLIKVACPNFSYTKIETMTEQALRLEPDFWFGVESRCLLGQDSRGNLLPCDSFTCAEKLMTKRLDLLRLFMPSVFAADAAMNCHTLLDLIQKATANPLGHVNITLHITK